MWNQRKIFEDMTKDLNHVLFGGLKWPRNWASESDIQHTSKSSSNRHVKQHWCKTNENVLRKWPKTGVFTYFGAQSDPKIEPLRSILSTHLKVLAMSVWSNMGATPVKTFWENDQRPEFLLFAYLGAQSGPKNWASEAHIPHTAETTCNEHVKQYWCETSPEF